MKITAETRVSDLLDAYPEAVEVLAEFNPHFAKLRNRVLRKIMAPRVTLAQAAQIAQVDVGAMLTVLARATGQAPPPCCGAGAADLSGPAPAAARPPFLDQFQGDFDRYLEFYNRERAHQGLGRETPHRRRRQGVPQGPGLVL